MIDTWLLATLCLLLLTGGALVRVARTKTRYDRYVAAQVAVTTVGTAGLCLSIALGTLMVLDVTVILALVCFSVILAAVSFSWGESA
jgi:multisubunit Na+/H+ antiporter MnhF subunit